MFAAALNALAIGIIVCDDTARLIFANATARELAQKGSGGPLHFRGKDLRAATLSETQSMTRLIRDAALGARGGAIRLSGRNGERTFPVLIAPLAQTTDRSVRSGYALLVVGESAHNPWVTEAILSKLFQLSQTQASIAIAIFNGQSPEEIAGERGIKVSTVRTHLGEIFLRTRTLTQRDLIRLIGSLPPVAHG